MKINCGHKAYGYKSSYAHTEILENYLANVNKYEGQFIEENKKIAKDVLSGKLTDVVRHVPTVATGIIATLALFGLMMPDLALAASSGGSIDLGPLDRFFNEVYWMMFKVLMYITTPIWAWIGYILATGGASNEKRTLAKKVGTGLITGVGFVAGAPWATKSLFALWRLIFA